MTDKWQMLQRRQMIAYHRCYWLSPCMNHGRSKARLTISLWLEHCKALKINILTQWPCHKWRGKVTWYWCEWKLRKQCIRKKSNTRVTWGGAGVTKDVIVVTKQWQERNQGQRRVRMVRKWVWGWGEWSREVGVWKFLISLTHRMAVQSQSTLVKPAGSQCFKLPATYMSHVSCFEFKQPESFS